MAATLKVLGALGLAQVKPRVIHAVSSVRSLEPLMIAGALIILALLLTSVFADSIAPYPAVYVDMPNQLAAPSREHLFGTDHVGRDIFSRVVYGTRITLRVGVVVMFVVLAVGVPAGLLAGYLGGGIEAIIMRTADMLFAFPSLVLAMAIAGALGGGLLNASIAVAIASWPFYARLTRSAVLGVKGELYVEAARSLGAKKSHVLLRHVVPNAIGPILVQGSMDMGWFILNAAALSFIGVGAQQPAPEWGLMISNGRTYIIDQWWISAFPGAAIFITVLGFSLVGESVRDALDPRLRRR